MITTGTPTEWNISMNKIDENLFTKKQNCDAWCYEDKPEDVKNE